MGGGHQKKEKADKHKQQSQQSGSGRSLRAGFLGGGAIKRDFLSSLPPDGSPETLGPLHQTPPFWLASKLTDWGPVWPSKLTPTPRRRSCGNTQRLTRVSSYLLILIIGPGNLSRSVQPSKNNRELKRGKNAASFWSVGFSFIEPLSLIMKRRVTAVRQAKLQERRSKFHGAGGL